MRRKLLALCAAALLPLALLATSDTPAAKAAPAAASSYGIYGVVTYPGSAVVISPTVSVYKWNGSSWVYHGSTIASACGYYTYDTGGTGNFMARVDGFYGLRNASCGTHFANEPVGGWQSGNVTWWNPQLRMDVPTT
jgi:hypothetical protein